MASEIWVIEWKRKNGKVWKPEDDASIYLREREAKVDATFFTANSIELFYRAVRYIRADETQR